MFPPRYFPSRYFTARFFPPSGISYTIFSAGAVIRAEHLGLTDVAAVVKKPTTSSTTAFSIIRTENVASLSVNAILQSIETAGFSIDAELEGRVRALYINAVLLSPAQSNFPLSAWIGNIPVEDQLDAIATLAGLDATSATAMLAFDGTAAFIDTTDTSSYVAFAGGVEENQNITLIPGVQAQAEIEDIDFTDTVLMLDTNSVVTQLDMTETTSAFIDFAGGMEEVTDD